MADIVFSVDLTKQQLGIYNKEEDDTRYMPFTVVSESPEQLVLSVDEDSYTVTLTLKAGLLTFIVGDSEDSGENFVFTRQTN